VEKVELEGRQLVSLGKRHPTVRSSLLGGLSKGGERAAAGCWMLSIKEEKPERFGQRGGKEMVAWQSVDH